MPSGRAAGALTAANAWCRSVNATNTNNFCLVNTNGNANNNNANNSWAVAAGRKTVEEVARWLNDGPIAYYEQFNDHGRVLKLRRVFYAMFIKDRNTEEVKPCIGS